MNSQELVKYFTESDPSGVTGLASRLNVSATTVYRWLTGRSKPRPALEGRLRALYKKQQLLAGRPSNAVSGSSHSPAKTEHQMRTAVGATLAEVREILHRNGRLSSRHEALDEIAKLLFAHVMSIDTGGEGIGKHIIQESMSPANALREFVSDSFRSFLPDSLSTELGVSDFELKIRTTEDRLGIGLINCFAEKAPKREILRARGVGQLDILNDAFGQFLVDSFVDEKELGQYLTPTEVVRTMVALGLDSLEHGDLESLYSTDPSKRNGVILDPSCGVGSFLAETLRVIYANAKSRLAPADLDRWVTSVLKHNIIGIDKSERMVRLATTNLALFGAPAANLHLANSLIRAGTDQELSNSLVGKASLILTNPPFGAEFSGMDLWGYRIAQAGGVRESRTVDSEILFLERYIDWLAPNGVLVSIVPDSVLTNRGLFREIRTAISEAGELLSVVSLPTVTFAAAGTSTKTSILHFRKTNRKDRKKTYFAICHNVGYEVATKGSQRHKIPNSDGQLSQIVAEAIGNLPTEAGRRVLLDPDNDRWDATYQAGLPLQLQETLEDPEPGGVRVSRVAFLSEDRTNPQRTGEEEFRYVEISDVDAKNCVVDHKLVNSSDAPSRARKVIRSGDVLVSTVRPERRTVGVVGKELDGGVCSTGFAVLRPLGINPHILARLLQSDFANSQILRNNAGIAYPAINEHCLLEVLLPMGEDQLNALAAAALELDEARSRLQAAQNSLDVQLSDAINVWQVS